MSAKNLIVGTGPTALAAAMAFRRLRIPFEVIDVGYDLEDEKETGIRTLAAIPVSRWPRRKVDALFPPPVTSSNGVEKRFSFGSSFPYRRPECLSISSNACTIDVSHGYGGFGNVWGAATLPYAIDDLEDWPISYDDLARSYRHISHFVPLSAERDDLQTTFPIHSDHATPLQRSEQTENLLRALSARFPSLKANGIAFGRARVAVDASGGPSTCQYCGACLDGCVYGSLFNPRLIWKKLEGEGIKIHKGFYALEFQESADGIVLSTVDVRKGTVRQWDARRLFLGAGVLATTRLVARSLKLIDRPIRILDSQYFFFPLLAYRPARDLSVRFTLAEVFLEVLNKRISDKYIHFQVYGLNNIFRQTLAAMVPSPLRHRTLLSLVESRFYLFQGYLHSAQSGHLELTITSSHLTKDEVHIRGVENPNSRPVAKQAQALLRRELARFGLIPWGYLKMVPLGRSFHAGGSFPAGSKHSIYSSDLVGRPAGLNRVHLLDASTFPNIPATTITYTAMANADRVITETHKQGFFD